MEGGGTGSGSGAERGQPCADSVRILHNPTNGYVPFILSGILLNGLNVGLLLTAAPMIIRELHKPRYKDCSPLSIIAGKICPVLVHGHGFLHTLTAGDGHDIPHFLQGQYH